MLRPPRGKRRHCRARSQPFPKSSLAGALDYICMFMFMYRRHSGDFCNDAPFGQMHSRPFDYNFLCMSREMHPALISFDEFAALCFSQVSELQKLGYLDNLRQQLAANANIISLFGRNYCERQRFFC
jgi:hypothetical protein